MRLSAARELAEVCMRGLSLFCAFMSLVAPVLTSAPITAQTRQTAEQKAGRYTCPMHREITTDKPGSCPKCGMALRSVGDSVKRGTVTANTAGLGAGAAHRTSAATIPDIRVRDDNGRTLRFYSDLVQGKTVAINFIFTTCTTICPSLTVTLRSVQQELAERALDVQLISISVDPTTDTPERLHDFAAKFNAGPGWTFVTGDKADIESLLHALGAPVASANDHTPMILINDDVTGFRTRTSGLSRPSAVVTVIAESASRK
jgi:cytochrome oxidase Cu insertion factor (SCO1/SenC/PrrC family)